MSTTKITDVEGDAVNLLPNYHRGQPGIEAFLRVLVRPIQRFEDAAWDVLTLRGLSNATGVQLDTLGAIVGQKRLGLDDGTYRRFISARITVNRSRGRVDDVIKVTQLVLADDSVTIHLAQGGVATMVMFLVDIADDLASLLVVSFLRATVAGGVRLLLEWSDVPTDEMFFWDTTDWDDSLDWSAAIE